MTTTDTHHSIPFPRCVQAYRSALEGNVLVVTGAGVSAESGIPTFRSVDGTGIDKSPLIDLAQQEGLRLKGPSGTVVPQLVEFLTT